MSVISLTYSTCVVYNVSDLRTSDFSYTKAIAHEFLINLNIYFSSFTGARNYTMIVTSVTMTYSTCLLCV